MMTSNTPCSIPRLARVAVLLAGMSLTSSLFAAERLAPMLDLQGVGQDPTLIDYAKLPALAGQHSLVTAGHKNESGMQAQIFDRADLDDPTKWNFRLHS